MNKQKIFKLVAVIICIIMAFGVTTFSACFNEPEELGPLNYIDINSVEELYAMERDKSYKLNCDIDLQNNYWTPLSIRAFDGNGHIISNCLIKDVHNTDENWAYGKDTAFFSEVSFIENVSFKNITVIASDADQIAVVVGCLSWDELRGEAIKNVNVENCKVTGVASNAGNNISIAIIAGRKEGGEIANCFVKECTIDVTIPDFNADIGIATGCEQSFCQYENINILNCNVNINFNDKYGALNLGGIVGQSYTSSIISKCTIAKSNFKVQTVSENGAARVGGIAGWMCASSKAEDGAIDYCSSVENSFEVSAYYNYTLGGIAGRCQGSISNCLSDNNSFNGKIVKKANNSLMGGICGSSYNTLRNSVVQNCKINGIIASGSSIFTASVVGQINASVAYCLSNNNVISGSPKDIFAPESQLIFKSYIYNCANSYNVNNIPSIEQENWTSVLDIMTFDKTIWGQNQTGDLYLI